MGEPEILLSGQRTRMVASERQGNGETMGKKDIWPNPKKKTYILSSSYETADMIPNSNVVRTNVGHFQVPEKSLSGT